ncbi:MAG: hypothetical protein E7213_02995 [Clostridium sp.]|nr:hypothetical protein [Clostridium sp.]
MTQKFKYKFQSIQKNKYVIYTLCLSIVLLFEIYAYYSLNYVKNEEKHEILQEENNIELSTIIYELKDKNLNILNMQKINENSYTFEVRVKGEKQEVYKVLKNLNNFTIIDYEFNVASNNIDGKVILSYN